MIKHDYKPQNNLESDKATLFNGNQSKIPAWMTHPYLILGSAVFVFVLAYMLSPSEQAPELSATVANLEPATPKSDVETIEISLNKAEAIDDVKSEESEYSSPIDIQLAFASPDRATSNNIPIVVERNWQTEAVKKGDNLSKIFKRIGLTPQDTFKVAGLDKNTQLLKKLKPGQVINYQLDSNNQFSALKYAIDIQNTLYVENSSTGLASRIENKPLEYRTAYASGVITNSLFVAGKSAGMSDTQVMELANIFDWDIDFILDIREGDSFSLIYEEKYLDGEKIGNGKILAAEFINQGESFKAVRYTDSNNRSNYYTPEGRSMRKAFLRAPLNFKYISSSFKPRRFHPILKRWKAHRGIDYRAKTGTPIRAAGDGKVIASSSNKYNGKYVFIQHGQGIVTKYLHMSRRAVSKNKRVKQGQVIGYVGMTGLAEAPHLHYEFLVNGVHRNPRTVKLPKAKPIANKEKAQFITNTTPLLEQLQARNNVLATSNNTAP